ncbi:MAG TPA: type II toxin-antitoxin system VapC family toxin [Solirubrobacteraceae bacterium]
MILDTSAIVAVLLKEPGCEALIECLAEHPEPGVGAPTMVESGIVLSARLGPSGQTLLARFAQGYELEILPFGGEHWSVAVQAFQRFGKGRHQAALNFGDCLTYAVARLAGEPLLCRGEDFAKTDLPLIR